MKYVSVKLPKPLIEKVDSVLEENGYTSRPEFIKDAIRKRLDQVKEISKE